MKLSNQTLTDLPDDVARPGYDRDSVRVGIVHLGVGGFHRAHQAKYLDRLMNQGQALDWAICGMGVLPGDAKIRDVLQAQNGLYTLVEKHPDGREDVTVVGSIVEFVLAPDDPAAAVERLADPAVRIVSLTVTEGGYNLDPVTGEYVLDDARVQADLAHPDRPATTFGLVCAALALRRDRGVAPFTVMSCDNIQGNGHVAQQVFTSHARALDPALADWIEQQVSFPNSMVDRITPQTTDADRADLAERHGIDDGWPVVCEDFTQWVLEDRFVNGRPPFEAVGVQVVDDVVPYELMKLRLLNASHQALAYPAALAGYRQVHEAMADPLIADFVLSYMRDEATPTLDEVPGVDLDHYQQTLIERFSNAHVADTVARLAAETSDRIPKFLLPVVRANVANARPVRLSAAVLASWALYCEGVDERGQSITVVDPMAEQLTAIAVTQREQPEAFLANRALFGDLVDDDRLRTDYLWALESLRERGIATTLAELLGR